MNKKALVEKILGLTRAQKEFFVDNFEKIERVLAKEAQLRFFLKEAQDGNVDLDTQALQILVSGLEMDPQALRETQSYVQTGQTDQDMNSVFSGAFAAGYAASGLNPAHQDFILDHLMEMIDDDPDGFVSALAPMVTYQEVPEEPVQEQAPVQDGIQEQNRSFSKVFGIDKSEVEFSKTKEGVRYAIYRGVINIPVDAKNNVALSDSDASFIKKTIDSYMVSPEGTGFFEPKDPEEAPFRPDEVTDYDPEDRSMVQRVRDLKRKGVSDPLTSRYKEFFEEKSRHLDESSRVLSITQGFENRVLDVYNHTTGSSETSYNSLISKYKSGKLPSGTLNKLRHISAAVRKRVYGAPLSKKDIETLGPYGSRRPEDQELFENVMGMKAIDDLSNDYIGKMQKLFIGDKIGQDTHEKIMALGELVFGKSLNDSFGSGNNVTLTQLVSGEADVASLTIPRSLFPDYNLGAYVSNDEISPEVYGAYRNQIARSIEAVNAAFEAQGIAPEDAREYLENLYAPQSYDYYKHTAEVTRHYQIQTELSRLSSMGNRSSNAMWCSRCGRFRPAYRKDTNNYIVYQVGEGKNAQIKKTYNMPPSQYNNKLKQIADNRYTLLQHEEGVGADDPITEYEKLLLSPEALEVVSQDCSYMTLGKCDYENNMFPNLLSEADEINTEAKNFMGFVPLTFKGREVEKIPHEVIGGKFLNANASKVGEADTKAYFPPEFEETMTQLHGEILEALRMSGGNVSEESITNDLVDTISLVSSMENIQNTAELSEESNPELQAYYDSASRVVRYLGETIKSSPEEMQKLTELLQEIREGGGRNEWADENTMLELESLRKFFGLFGYDSFSQSFLRRMNLDADVAAIEGSARDAAGIDDVTTHMTLFNDALTGDTQVKEVATMSSRAFLKSNKDIKKLIRQLVMSKFGDTIRELSGEDVDPTEVGRLYPAGEPFADAEKPAIARDDNAIKSEIDKITRTKSVRLPRPEVVFKELGKNFKGEYSDEFIQAYIDYTYRFDPNKYKTEEVDIFFFDVPIDTVFDTMYELIQEYRSLPRSMAIFEDPIADIDVEKSRNKLAPGQMRKQIANRLAIPYSSPGENDGDKIIERAPGGSVTPDTNPLYRNIAWYTKVYRDSLEPKDEAGNPVPLTAEYVAERYRSAGITNKEITDPALDLALLIATELEDREISFAAEPKDGTVKKELEIELMKQALREELKQVYIATHGPEGKGSSDPQPFKGLRRDNEGHILQNEVSLVMLAATILGKDPRQYTTNKAADYEEIKASPVYQLVSDLVNTPTDEITQMFAELAGPELSGQEYPVQFNPRIPSGQERTYREMNRRFRGQKQPHLTAVHDSLIKYLISPTPVSHWILKDLSSNSDYLDEPTRRVISTLTLGPAQGPNQKFSPASIAYHTMNASQGFFPPSQQGKSFFTDSTNETVAFLRSILGGRSVGFPVMDIMSILDGSGGREDYSKKKRKEKGKEPSRKQRQRIKEDVEHERNKTASSAKWYKKAQAVSPAPKTFEVEDVLFYSDRDLATSFRNRLRRQGTGFSGNANLPKTFTRPFSDFGSISSLKKYSEITGLKAIPVTSGAKELINKMGLRLP